ncbi:putative MFS transporter [Hortaea werneckii]|uniref:Major facilitator superfamily (MFS) profile domain-containing protein n=1 Tax=Hortaea werneckii EXF-2000 TaxID=1157616 RepID=A0A1Z5TL50_HORWE|nr:putative MFS transporter [Hortaea werneckii]OTA36756.1 hypothetical protein BTJ68_02649 [Hortaea werneckii EXF-2000]KAI6835562.1 putative MFS transporter [Hortaea werneckii]KAI6931040.1 putative MFS transporter [Hortaea werneckii]KAI6935665.1 putative MFS transporter [Hortaea werneckii]
MRREPREKSGAAASVLVDDQGSSSLTADQQLAGPRKGDDTARGQALFPVPAEDPNDPLQWPKWKKNAILVVCSLYSFLSNTSLLGPSVYISLFAEQFGISHTKASGLISYPNICYGIGTLIMVPAYLKFGRRPVMLVSLVIYLVGLVGCSVSDSYGALMACRIIHTISSSVCEALPVQLVNDIFFLHERGSKLGYYTVCLCWGSTGPLYAGYMLAGGYSWRLFFYVEIAFAGLLLILAFVFVEETAYKRDSPSGPSLDNPEGLKKVYAKSELENKEADAAEHVEVETLVPARRTFLATLRPWSAIDHDEPFFLTSVRSFTYFLVPSVLWVITSYGIYIGLGALVFNYTFPIKIVQPPYGWSEENSGLIALGNIVGYGLAIPLTWTSDALAARLTRKNNGMREAEMRLGVLLPAMVIAPAGLIVYGMTGQRNLHWIGYFAGVAMTDWGSFFYFTFTLAYAVDSYNANTSEMLIAMCVGKQLISFAFGLYLLDWVQESGYDVIVAGVFTGVLLANNLALLVFMAIGKRIRVFYASTLLSKMHRKTIKQPHEAL